ncbi:Hypothetical_protein [Hexamita inflata]|uniref:Hypothetical_protein n=1 Tax=Hexamita inflata TaxID=28002 RepID=A0AA86RJ14_9EUKA|nr:Hypothetical protein HINF_LOCUS65127 [Hexamita inflata]
MTEFTPDPEAKYNYQNNQDITAENTKLKMQLFEIAQHNYQYQKQLQSYEEQIQTLNDQIDAEQIAHDTQVKMYEQQLKISKSNEEQLKQQIQKFYSSDKVDIMKELGFRYIEDFDQLKLKTLEKYKVVYEEQLSQMKQQMQQNFDFMIQMKENQIETLKRQAVLIKDHETQKYNKLKEKYNSLKMKVMIGDEIQDFAE